MSVSYAKMKRLFLRQSYLDAWEDYRRALRKKSFLRWDYIVLTASNEEQADAYDEIYSYNPAHYYDADKIKKRGK